MNFSKILIIGLDIAVAERIKSEFPNALISVGDFYGRTVLSLPVLHDLNCDCDLICIDNSDLSHCIDHSLGVFERDSVFDAVFINGKSELYPQIAYPWIGHSHLRVFCDADTLISNINHVCGDESGVEIERKYLIEYPCLSELASMRNCNFVEIEQLYITGESEFRIRKRGLNDSVICTYTVKGELSGLSRTETERKITLDEYNSIKRTHSYFSLTKRRYCILSDYQYFELDIYPFINYKAILEIELLHEGDSVILPSFIKVIEDVSANPAYSNYRMAIKLMRGENIDD